MSVAEMSVNEFRTNYARIRREAYAPKPIIKKPEEPKKELEPAVSICARTLEKWIEEDQAFGPIVQPRRSVVLFEQVLRETCRHFRMSKAEIMATRRHASIVRPRQTAMFLAYRFCLGISLPKIAQKFGMDHTTVLSGCRKIQSLIDAQHAETVQAINSITVELGVRHV